MSQESTFSPNTERSPASFHVSTAAYKELDFSDRKIGDEIIFVLKGRVTEVGEDFDDKSRLRLQMEVETIEDHSRRTGLDKDGRVS